MISWINGRKIYQNKSGNKAKVVIECGGIGYEVQLLLRQLDNIPAKENFNLWLHQVTREDGSILFGFIKLEERDLFRKLISISGIGPQIAMALLEDFKVEELVFAIVNQQTSKLIKSQGVGKRVAERLFVELKSKLDEFQITEDAFSLEKERANSKPNDENTNQTYKNELSLALKALGYNEVEINQVLSAKAKDLKIAEKSSFGDNSIETCEGFDELLKSSLVWLSENLT